MQLFPAPPRAPRSLARGRAQRDTVGAAASRRPRANVAVLDAVLWHERRLLESLQRTLEDHRLALDAGATDRLCAAAAEADRLRRAVRETAVLRAMEADSVAAQVGLAPAPRLSALASALGGAWGTILLEHAAAVDALADAMAGPRPSS